MLQRHRVGNRLFLVNKNKCCSTVKVSPNICCRHRITPVKFAGEEAAEENALLIRLQAA